MMTGTGTSLPVGGTSIQNTVAVVIDLLFRHPEPLARRLSSGLEACLWEVLWRARSTGSVSFAKILSGLNAFEISNLQEQET